MLFRVLGDVVVVDDDGTVTTVGAAKQRALLALLLIDANSVVSRTALIDGIWGERLPANADSALHVTLSRLRSRLGVHGERICAERAGYRLDAAPDEIDILRAESLLRDGRSALAAGDAETAADAFERGLALWTGDALHDLSDYPFNAVAAGRLADLRMVLVEARNDAYLICGRHLEVLGDAESWIDAAPLREHLRAQKVAALYRAGRQVEALRACDDWRKELRDDCGLEPSPPMQDLERRVLDQDPVLGATESGFLTPLPEWTAQTMPFVGRVDETEQVMRALADASKSTMRMVLVTGEAGIGKSRFLLHVAHSVGRDAIVIPLHVNHLWESTLHALARAVAQATLALSDEELQFILRDVPDLPQDVSFVRSAARSLVSGEDVTGLLDDTTILNGAARWMAALSARAPVVLLVDDFDTAGTPINHVVAKLSVLSKPKRVLVVAGARGPVERTAPQVAQLVALATEDGWAETIELGALSPDDIDALLGRMHVAPRNKLVARLVDLTGGHPLILAEILSSGSVERVVAEWPTRPRVADVVRRRTAELGQATADVLRAASLFESDFSLELLAEVVGASEATITQLIDRALDAHVVQPTTATSYRFTHRAYRQALIQDLGDEYRTRAHRRIAIVLEQRGNAPAAVLTAHWAGAAGADASAKVAKYARDAAREAMALSEPSSAVHWLEIASPHVDDGDRGALLVELAEAQQLAGNPRGVDNLREAVRIALEEHRDDLILRIIGTQLPAWSTLPGVSGPETRRLLGRALEIVDDDVMLSRANAWLATDISLDNPAEGAMLMDRALTLARSSGDRDALVDCLMRFAATASAPHDVVARQSAIAELLDVARPLDIMTRYFTLSTLAITAVQAGDIDTADAAIAEADSVAGPYALGPVQWSCLARGAWRAALAGDLIEAERGILAAADFGTQAGITTAADTALLQLGLLHWQLGRLGERVEMLRKNQAQLLADFPGIGLVFARALADNDDGREEARAILDAFAENCFVDLRRGPFWSSLLLFAAETALLAGAPEASATIRDLLLPFRDQVAHPGMWVTGPIAYAIGIACLGCGDEDADVHLDYAVDIARRLRAPLLVEQAQRAVTLVPS
jgi:DNA-binding SARP family transcriptional activator